MSIFQVREIAEEKFYVTKEPIKDWNVKINNIGISKLVKTKSYSK